MTTGRARTARWPLWPLLAIGVAVMAVVAAACSGPRPDIAASGVRAEESSLIASSAIDSPEQTSTALPALSVDVGVPATEPPTTGNPPPPTAAEPTTVATPVTTIGSVTAAPVDAGRPHPDCSTGCTVLIEGDSLTSSLARFLGERVSPSVTVIDSGQGGKRIDEMLVTARSDVDLHADGRPDDILFLWAGINDLNQKRHAADPAENARLVADLLGDYVTERRANGWDWIVVLTMPRTTPAIEGWVELNHLLTSTDIGADQVLDIGADPVLADPFDPVHKNPDGLHLSGEGARHVAVVHLLPVVQAPR